jgi:hypothetical protein
VPLFKLFKTLKCLARSEENLPIGLTKFGRQHTNSERTARLSAGGDLIVDDPIQVVEGTESIAKYTSGDHKLITQNVSPPADVEARGS